MGAVRFQSEFGYAQRRGERARRDLHAIAGNLAVQGHSSSKSTIMRYINAFYMRLSLLNFDQRRGKP